jgi:hypothetical protein
MNNKDLPAFPIDSNDLKQVETGLTKREYIAAMAMQGLCSKYTLSTPADQITVTKLSVELSDELLKQLGNE